jgi:hypothetical protein
VRVYKRKKEAEVVISEMQNAPIHVTEFTRIQFSLVYGSNGVRVSAVTFSWGETQAYVELPVSLQATSDGSNAGSILVCLDQLTRVHQYVQRIYQEQRRQSDAPPSSPMSLSNVYANPITFQEVSESSDIHLLILLLLIFVAREGSRDPQ